MLTLVIIIALLLLIYICLFIHLKLELSMLRFKISRYPETSKFIFDKLLDFCIKENVYFFEKSSEFINKGIIDVNERAVGKYIYIKPDFWEKHNELISRIKEVESKFPGKTYYDICKLYNIDIDVEDYTMSFSYPRILLSSNLKGINNDLMWYYMTFIHELGHHYMISRKNDYEHTELDADLSSWIIVKEIFDNEIQSLFYTHLLANIDIIKEITIFEKIKMKYYYIIFLYKNNKSLKSLYEILK